MKWSGWRWLTTIAAMSSGCASRKMRWNEPVPEVEQDARRSLADEVRGARGALTIRIGGTGPEHRQDHACAVIARG